MILFLASVDPWFLQNWGPTSCGLRKRKTGWEQQTGLLLITPSGFLPIHPTAALPEKAGRDVGVMEERSSWVEERLAQIQHLPPALLHLSWVVFTCARLLQLVVQAWRMPHLQPAWSRVSPQSHPAHKMPVWLMYICMVLFPFYFLEINFLFIAWGREKTNCLEKIKLFSTVVAGAGLS